MIYACSGIVNFLGRLVAGVLFDRLGYSRLMSGTGLLLAATLASIYTAGQHIQGLIACVWLVYFLGFAHFSTIPAQVSVLLEVDSYLVSMISRRCTACSRASLPLWLLAALDWLSHSPMAP